MTAHLATPGLTLARRYSVGDPIGRGGMGEVRSGWDKVLERPVAIKLLREDVASNAGVRRRFEAEARSAARLVHPNIVQVYDSGEDGGIPFIVMERLPGRSLRDYIRAGRLSVSEATSMALQVLAALQAAHRADLVHRDIKPANILHAEDDHWKVADFGIAKSLQPTGADETVTGMVIGTPAYLPPERLLGGDATPGGDIYALAVILYEALAGRRPFEATDLAGWVAAAASPPPSLRQLRPDVPTTLAAAIERGLSREASQRFVSSDEMADAIRTVDTGDPTGIPMGVPIGVPIDVADERTGSLAVPPATPEAGDTEVLPRPGTRGPTRLWLAGLAAGIAALVALAVSLSAGTGPAKVRSPATPTTLAVQVTTTTAVPVVSPPRPGHDHPQDTDGGGGKGGNGG
ncbi:MAG TPA: serine/threonine-protein kinase [Acidimicrobiales bacterium]|nr:serine/threonine-protein kinase [Acidimicrobiales bacterium]